MARTQTIPEELTKLHHIVGDETCYTGHRWMVLGTTISSDINVRHVRAKWRAMKANRGLATEEVKWEKTNKKRLDRYKILSEVACYLTKIGVIQFHALAIPLYLVDHKKYNEGVPDIGYNKFLFHLLKRYCRVLPKENKYYVTLDDRSSKLPLRPFQDMLNFAARAEGMDHWPFRRLHFGNSKSDPLFEINDLLLGAIGFEINGKHEPPIVSEIKADLAQYTRRGSGLSSFRHSSTPHVPNFSLWVMDFNDQPTWRLRRHKLMKERQRKERERQQGDP